MAASISYVVEAAPFDPVTQAARLVRVSSGGSSRRFRQSGNWQLYRGALTSLPSTAQRIAMDGTLIGSRSLPELGEISISLLNVPQKLDWFRLQWVGRSIKILRGVGDDIDSFETVLVADVVAAPFTDDTLTLQLAGGNAWLDANVSQSLYPGTGLLGGHASLKATPLLQIYGLVENVTPDLLDDALQLYRLHDRQMSQVLWVRDRGQLLTFHADYASGSSLLTAAQSGAIPKGFYATSLAAGVMALGAKPVGRVTFAARGDNQDGYAETAADIAGLLMVRSGVPLSLIDQASLDAAEQAFAANAGLVLRAPLLLRDVLDRLALTAECITTVTSGGRIGWTRLAVSLPTRTLRGPRLQSVQGLVTPPPPRALKLGYRPNWTPMAQDELATLIANDPGVPSSATPPASPYEGQLWQDTSATVIVLRRWNGSVWAEVSRLITGTSQLVDDADLGGTANWAGVTGSGRPEDNATRNVSRGVYTVNTLYSRGDIVRFSDAAYLYISLSPSQNIAPPDGAYWALFVADGADGADGGPGSAGFSVATVKIYQRSASGAPPLPTSLSTFTFATAVLTGLNNGWIAGAVPPGTDPLYVSVAVASSQFATDTIAFNEWTAAIIESSTGAPGANGLTTSPVFIYQRTASAVAPALPTATVTYDFTTGVIVGLNNGWSADLLPTGGAYRWRAQAAAAAYSATDAIAASEWATPKLQSQDGADGAPGGRTDYKFKRSATEPPTPTTDPPIGWFDYMPGGDDPGYMISGRRNSNDVLESGWAAPQRLTGDVTTAYINETPPSVPESRPLWYRPSTDELFSWGASGQWIRVGGSGDLALLNAVDTDRILSGVFLQSKTKAANISISLADFDASQAALSNFGSFLLPAQAQISSSFDLLPGINEFSWGIDFTPNVYGYLPSATAGTEIYSINMLFRWSFDGGGSWRPIDDGGAAAIMREIGTSVLATARMIKTTRDPQLSSNRRRFRFLNNTNSPVAVRFAVSYQCNNAGDATTAADGGVAMTLENFTSSLQQLKVGS